MRLFKNGSFLKIDEKVKIKQLLYLMLFTFLNRCLHEIIFYFHKCNFKLLEIFKKKSE